MINNSENIISILSYIRSRPDSTRGLTNQLGSMEAIYGRRFYRFTKYPSRSDDLIADQRLTVCWYLIDKNSARKILGPTFVRSELIWLNPQQSTKV